MSHASVIGISADSERQKLTTQIEALIGRLHPAVTPERRRDIRVAIPVLFHLTPLDADHEPIEHQISIVVGKNISRHGMSFYHEKPLPFRRAIIELAHPGAGNFMAEIDVSWCRFRRPGWYESGGRLIRSLIQHQELHDDTLTQFGRPATNLSTKPPVLAPVAHCRL